VNATVTDSANRSVTNLQPQNFHLWEDKIEQKIEYFSYEEVPISLGIVFDVSGSMKGKILAAREAATTFLTTGDSRDEYFLVEFTNEPQNHRRLHI
jgi:Ca-activated chloride channel family protein